MAITGKFVADFASFNAAVASAEVKLKSFETGSGKVSTSLTRMSNSLRGTKLIQDATLMAEAVERVGGISRLTGKDLARVGATASEAAAKMRAMGMTVPPGIQHIADAAKGATSSFGLLGSTFTQVFGAISASALISRGITAIMNLGKSAVQSANEFVDLANKTGWSIEAVQRAKFVADQTGTSLDAMTGAAFRLGIQLSGGKESVRDAVRDLGLAFADLKGMRPDQQFETIVGALGRMESATERNRIGVALFGKQFGEIASAVTEGYDKVAAGATIASTAQVQALERASDAWDAWKANVQTSVTSFLGQMVLLNQAQKEVASEGLRGSAALLEAQRRVLLGLVGARREDIALIEQQAARSATYAQQLASVRAELSRLTPAQRAEIDAALKLGENVDKLETEFHLTDGALRIFTDSVKAAASPADKLAQSYRQVLSDARNLQGAAFFDADAATIARAASNVEGVWMQERDAWQAAYALAQTARSEMAAAQDSAIEAALGKRPEASLRADEKDRAAMQEEQTEAILAAWRTEESAWKQHQDTLITGAGQMFAIIGIKSKKAAIAGALISTYQAIAKALSSAPWPFSLVLAAGAAAAGYAQVNAIRSQSSHRRGTRNLDFQEFGARSTAELHGQEAVIPRGGGHRLASEIAASLVPSATQRPSYAIHVNIPVQAWDGPDAVRMIREKALPVIVDALKFDWDGFRGDFNEANA